MKKLLAIVLAVVMMMAVAMPVAADDVYVGPDWDAINAMDYDAQSDALYEWNLGEFNEALQTAKAEITDLNLRMALMAIADAKLLESGAFMPVQSNGGGYAISRVIPRTITSTSWGVDEYRWYTVMVANEIITSADREALTALWGSAADATAWYEAAAAYLTEHGYTLSDTYDFSSSYELATWDGHASSYTSDAYFIAATWAPLLEYDVKNVQQPGLAESYEVSEDGTVYTFHLRQGAKWVDQQGRELADVTADDWVAGMAHVADNNDALGYLMSADGGCGIKNYDAFVNGEVSFDEVGVKAIDDYTLQYTLEIPFPPFLSMMGYGCFAPLNRDFYKSQGGTFTAEGDEYTSGNYGTSPSTIAYCGAYLVSNFTEKNVTSYVANPTYWNAEAVKTPAVNIFYNDGSDTLRAYNEVKSGVIDGTGLNSSALVLAREEVPEGETETYFDLYHYTSLTDATTFCGWNNLHRGSWTNFNNESMGVSPQTEEMQNRTLQAMNNQNFRTALNLAFDRGAHIAVSVGDELKYTSMRNAYVPGTFAVLTAETTVAINGEDVTFPAGTYFGQIEQAQLEADGSPIKVWDPTADGGVGSGDGFDGWFNPEAAVEYLNKAIAELAQVGVEISTENPIYIDIPCGTYAETYVNQAQVYKQCIETNLGGNVMVNVIEFAAAAEHRDAYYRINHGNEANYDAAPGTSGWGPDYGDGQSYLDTIQPYGYMTKNIGLY